MAYPHTLRVMTFHKMKLQEDVGDSFLSLLSNTGEPHSSQQSVWLKPHISYGLAIHVSPSCLCPLVAQQTCGSSPSHCFVFLIYFQTLKTFIVFQPSYLFQALLFLFIYLCYRVELMLQNTTTKTSGRSIRTTESKKFQSIQGQNNLFICKFMFTFFTYCTNQSQTPPRQI